MAVVASQRKRRKRRKRTGGADKRWHASRGLGLARSVAPWRDGTGSIQPALRFPCWLVARDGYGLGVGRRPMRGAVTGTRAHRTADRAAVPLA